MVFKVQPVSHQLLLRKLAALWVVAVLWLSLGSSERFGWPGLLASDKTGSVTNKP